MPFSMLGVLDVILAETPKDNPYFQLDEFAKVRKHLGIEDDEDKKRRKKSQKEYKLELLSNAYKLFKKKIFADLYSAEPEVKLKTSQKDCLFYAHTWVLVHDLSPKITEEALVKRAVKKINEVDTKYFLTALTSQCQGQGQHQPTPQPGGPALKY